MRLVQWMGRRWCYPVLANYPHDFYQTCWLVVLETIDMDEDAMSSRAVTAFKLLRREVGPMKGAQEIVADVMKTEERDSVVLHGVLVPWNCPEFADELLRVYHRLKGHLH